MSDEPEHKHDDILATIRTVVTQEEEKDSEKGPLVLGASNRVVDESMIEAARNPFLEAEEGAVSPQDEPAPPSPMFDEEELRRLVAEIVREEMDTVMGQGFEDRIRRIVRADLAAMFTDARMAED